MLFSNRRIRRGLSQQSAQIFLDKKNRIYIMGPGWGPRSFFLNRSLQMFVASTHQFFHPTLFSAPSSTSATSAEGSSLRDPFCPIQLGNKKTLLSVSPRDRGFYFCSTQTTRRPKIFNPLAWGRSIVTVWFYFLIAKGPRITTLGPRAYANALRPGRSSARVWSLVYGDAGLRVLKCAAVAGAEAVRLRPKSAAAHVSILGRSWPWHPYPPTHRPFRVF